MSVSNTAMYKELERRIDETERSRLLAWPAREQPYFRDWGLPVLLEIGVICAVSTICLAVFDIEPIVVLLAIAAYLFVNWLLKIRVKVIDPWRDHWAASERVASYRNAVEAAQSVRVRHVESSEVVEVSHDEGTIYLFNVGDEHIFWIDPERLCTQWPNSEFEMVEVPGWDEEIGPFCYGKRLEVRDSLHFMEFDFEKLSVGRLIGSSLDSFLQEATNKHR